MDKKRLNPCLKIALITVVLLIIPIFMTIITKVVFANDLEITKTIGYNDIAGLIAQYYSIFLTLFLGIIVFFQTEKINALEKKDYDFYIGTNKVENKFELGNTFFIPNSLSTCSDATFSFTHSIYNDKVIHFINIKMDETSSDFKIIPINLITKNKLMISSICFNKITFKIKFNDSNITSLEKIFMGKNAIISGCLDNDSEILLGIGLNMPKYDVDMFSVDITMQLDIRDQYENITKFIVSNSILSENHNYYLTSSKTKKINK